MGGPGPQSVQIMKILFLMLVFKISHKFDYVNLKPYYLNFFGLGARLGLPGAPKCQNFRHFVFQVRSLKISHKIDHVNQKSYQLKFFGLGAPFGLPRAPKCQNFRILSFELESSKFYNMLILCNRIEIY